MMKNKAEELLQIVGHTPYDELRASIDIVLEIHSIEIEKINSIQWIMCSAYQAGKIEGIRQERKRRKGLVRN